MLLHIIIMSTNYSNGFENRTLHGFPYMALLVPIFGLVKGDANLCSAINRPESVNYSVGESFAFCRKEM